MRPLLGVGAAKQLGKVQNQYHMLSRLLKTLIFLRRGDSISQDADKTEIEKCTQPVMFLPKLDELVKTFKLLNF